MSHNGNAICSFAFVRVSELPVSDHRELSQRRSQPRGHRFPAFCRQLFFVQALLQHLWSRGQEALCGRLALLGVTKKRFETVVHVLLDVAVEQGEPRLIRGEIDNRPAVVRDHDRILDNTRGFLAVDLS
jgi:hypothetical protein